MYTFLMFLAIQTATGVESEVHEVEIEASSQEEAYDKCLDAVDIHILDTSDSDEARVIAGTCALK